MFELAVIINEKQMKLAIVSLMFLTSLCVRAQDSGNTFKNSIHIGGGRRALVFAKYDRFLFTKKWTRTIAGIGFAGIPGDAEYDSPRTNIIIPEIGQLFGRRSLFVELGLEPAISFYGNVSYIDLNALVGFRYQFQVKQSVGMSLKGGYYPRLYYSYERGANVPFYFGIGLSF